jgi:hypothetical protein
LHENYLREQIDIDGIIGDGDLATPAPLVWYLLYYFR